MDHHHHQHFLDLDAEVFGDQLEAVIELIGVPAPQGIVDLGAGTGVGSHLLRKRYPDATLTCVDNDPQMLELLGRRGFEALQADLDDGFPRLTGTPTIDLVWASSSLHHVADPANLLAGAHRALAPGGVLIAVELATLPSFLSEPSGAQLEERCHAAAAAEGWNHHSDWTHTLEAAGFAVTKSEVSATVPVTPAARAYAEQWFTRFAHLAGLTAADRNALTDLLPRFATDLELAPRATRTVWLANA